MQNRRSLLVLSLTSWPTAKASKWPRAFFTCGSMKVSKQPVQRTERYKRYASRHGQDAAGNPSGGNLFRGLYNIVPLGALFGSNRTSAEKEFNWLLRLSFGLSILRVEHGENPKQMAHFDCNSSTGGSRVWVPHARSPPTCLWTSASNMASVYPRRSQARFALVFLRSAAQVTILWTLQEMTWSPSRGRLPAVAT